MRRDCPSKAMHRAVSLQRPAPSGSSSVRARVGAGAVRGSADQGRPAQGSPDRSFARPACFRFEHRQAAGADRSFVECVPCHVVGVVARFTPAARAPDLAGEVGALSVHVQPSRSSPKPAARSGLRSLPVTDDRRAAEGVYTSRVAAKRRLRCQRRRRGRPDADGPPTATAKASPWPRRAASLPTSIRCSGKTSVTPVPLRPARPVRPTRCT